jgi:hypothetical protein
LADYSFNQSNLFHLYRMIQENRGGIGEFGSGLGGQETTVSLLCQTDIHFGMTA